MRHTSLVLFSSLLIGLWAANVCAQITLLPQSDTQNWNDVYLAVPILKTVDFVLLGTVRNGRDITRPVDERVGVGFSFKVGKYLTVVPNYLHIEMQPFAGRKVLEERLSVATTAKIPVRRFNVSDRNLFERRFRPLVDATRYRNRLQVDHPIGPTKHHISLFIADEVFYDWFFNAWVRNRFTVGGTKVVNKHLTFDLYYLRQNDSHSFPGDLHVIGSAWRFHL